MSNTDVAILIPCYNEGLTIGKVVKDCKNATSDIDQQVTVFVYDNNSTDNTVEESLNAGAIVGHVYQQGKGNVVRQMFQDINAKCYVLIDGDDTYSTKSIPNMIRSVLYRRTDMVVGDRLSSSYFSENKRLFHNFGNSLVRFCINSIFHSNIKDVMTGYRAFSYRFVKTFAVLSKGFEIETEMSIVAIENNMLIENQVIDYQDRPEGSTSKLNTYSDGIKVLKKIISLFRNYRPLQFFSLLSIIGIVISIALFIPNVWLPFMKTGLVEKIPTLISCGFLLLISVISYFSGLILDAILKKEEREFEFRLQVVSSSYDKLFKK